MELETYVPADERICHNKVKELASNSVEAALQFLIPTLKTLNYQPCTIDHFKSFVELHCFFWAQKPSNLAKADKWTKLQLQKFLPQKLFQQILSQKEPFMYPLPQFLRGNFFLFLAIHFSFSKFNLGLFHVIVIVSCSLKIFFKKVYKNVKK